MASLFAELEAFDRPFLDHTISIGNSKTPHLVPVVLRQPSAEEQDQIEAYQMDEYGRIMTEYTAEVPGKMSELARMQALYGARPKADLVSQFAPTRASDIQEYAAELAGIDLGLEAVKIAELKGEERDAYVKAQNEMMKPHEKAATKKIEAEISEELSVKELVDQLAQININIKAQVKARRAAAAQFLFATVYKPTTDGTEPTERAWDSADQVRKTLSPDTIDTVDLLVRKRLLGDPTAPFGSPGASEPEKPTSSPETSEPESPDSGNSTEDPKPN